MEWRNRIIGYDTKPASQFTPNPSNWRVHPSIQREALRGLLGDVGWVGAVLENKQTGNLIDGHARIEEALNQDDNTLIPYLLVDLSPDEEKLVLASFDPISALATSDKDKLESLLKEVSTSSEAVDSLLSEIAKKNGVLLDGELKDAEPQIDKAEELRQKWGTETGQLWVIGNHRLLCGDARSSLDIVLGSAECDLVLTDPPYGISYDRNAKHKGIVAVSKVVGDDESFDPIFLLRFPALILWGANCYASKLPDSKTWLAWRKTRTDGEKSQSAEFELAWANCLSRSRYFEYLWSGFYRDGESGEYYHLTQKPVALMEWCLTLAGNKKSILDPFVGSGTTLVAAENLNRNCYAIEISPAYVAVCLERMTTAFPHLKIEKVDQAGAA